jgi:hypothetical protein
MKFILYLKEGVYVNKPRTIQELKENIRAEIRRLQPDAVERACICEQETSQKVVWCRQIRWMRRPNKFCIFLNYSFTENFSQEVHPVRTIPPDYLRPVKNFQALPYAGPRWFFHWNRKPNEFHLLLDIIRSHFNLYNL